MDARYIDMDNLGEMDIMYEKGIIDSESELIPISATPGFMRIYWNGTRLSYKNASFDDYGRYCINGLALKEELLAELQKLDASRHFPPNKHKTSVKSASVESVEPSVMGQKVDETVKKIIEEKIKTGIYQQQINEKKFMSDVYRKCLTSVPECLDYCIGLFQPEALENITKNTFFSDISLTSVRLPTILIGQLTLALCSPLCGVPLHPDIFIRLLSYTNFANKHEQSINKIFSKFSNKCMKYMVETEVECDHIPAFRLNFVPKIILPFFNRIRMKRFDLYEKLKGGTIFVIPKWSGLTPEKGAHLEFRYSFSDYEKTLAQLRSNNELTLNKVARSIYYECLSKNSLQIDGTYLPSYFVKTAVLWLCENENVTEIYKSDQDQDIIAQSLGDLWRNYACSCLKEHYCQHYFIEEINILQTYHADLLSLAYEKLKGWRCTDENNDDPEFSRPLNDDDISDILNVFDEFIPSVTDEKLIREDFQSIENEYFIKTDLSSINVTRYLDILSYIPGGLKTYGDFAGYLLSFTSDESPVQLPFAIKELSFSHFTIALLLSMGMLVPIDSYYNQLTFEENEYIRSSEQFFEKFLNIAKNVQNSARTMDLETLLAMAVARHQSSMCDRDCVDFIRKRARFKNKEINKLPLDCFHTMRSEIPDDDTENPWVKSNQNCQYQYINIQEGLLSLIFEIACYTYNFTDSERVIFQKNSLHYELCQKDARQSSYFVCVTV
ncbi:unnamed protein product [Didymodactylos carnosus]|uniref:Mab-21-like HhH/H2TH-like domain-containing protein n=1 Tax=Didymodactylos carnosus TaxID=1234261 RepID=A0A814JWY5_9BILA|nr:unnamed protein product [Didymodactylos carnosus]CAF3814326.1 unnamed protein product [Didymodactylos carnosus]